MKRTMMQVYVTGAREAIARYEQAFDAKLMDLHNTPEGLVYHSELDIQGHVLAVADATDQPVSVARVRQQREATDQPVTGNVMQFCLHFNEDQEDAVRKAYNVLQAGANILVPLGPCDFSPCMTDLIDAFGVRWCLFV